MEHIIHPMGGIKDKRAPSGIAATELTRPLRAPYNEPASGSSSVVERLLAKEEVGSSNLLFRSTFFLLGQILRISALIKL